MGNAISADLPYGDDAGIHWVGLRDTSTHGLTIKIDLKRANCPQL